MSSGDSAPLPVLVPAVLADYACQRRLTCCHAPWRASLDTADGAATACSEAGAPPAAATPGEPVAITARLRAVRAPAELVHAFEAACVRRGSELVLRQSQGRCVLLSERGDCRLQAVGGLAATPLSCRNFPRSVVDTPAGLEVAFTFGCPTVAERLATRPQPFAWSHRDPTTWSYPATTRVAVRLPWSTLRDVDFATLTEIRRGWWRELAAATDGGGLCAVFDALSECPAEPAPRPAATPARPAALAPLDPPCLMAITRALAGLAAGFEAPAAQRALWAALQHSPTPEACAQAADDHRAMLAAVAALLVQGAGVHDGLPVAAGLARAARLARRLVALLAALAPLAAGPGALHLGRDALVALAAVARTPEAEG